MTVIHVGRFLRLAAVTKREVDLGGNLAAGDKLGAFEVARRVLMPGAPHEIIVFEPNGRIIPTAIAGVPVDHTVGRGEFIRRMGEAAHHNRRRAGSMG